MGPHLEDTQRSKVLLRWFSPGIVEQVDGGDDDRDISTTMTRREPQSSVNSVKSHTFRNFQAGLSMVLDPSRP